MGIDEDLAKIARQERRLEFKEFDAETAWAILTALKAAANSRQASVAIDIQVNGHTLFAYAMAGTSPDNLDWIRRKRNLVGRYHRSSYAIGLKLERTKAHCRKSFWIPKITPPMADVFRSFSRGRVAWEPSPFLVCRSAKTTI